MKSLYRLFTVAILSMLLSGCASLVSVSVTPVPEQRNNRVGATAEKWSFLGITFDNDYVDQMTDDLKARCPNGVITGLLTKDEVYSYFLLFKRKITASGYCVKDVASNTGNNIQNPPTRRRR